MHENLSQHVWRGGRGVGGYIKDGNGMPNYTLVSGGVKPMWEGSVRVSDEEVVVAALGWNNLIFEGRMFMGDVAEKDQTKSMAFKNIWYDQGAEKDDSNKNNWKCFSLLTCNNLGRDYRERRENKEVEFFSTIYSAMVSGTS